jgi:hypothetical protein
MHEEGYMMLLGSHSAGHRETHSALIGHYFRMELDVQLSAKMKDQNRKLNKCYRSQMFTHKMQISNP